VAGVAAYTCGGPTWNPGRPYELLEMTALCLLVLDHFLSTNPVALTLAAGSMLVLPVRLWPRGKR
jgi:hypothetical protein